MSPFAQMECVSQNALCSFVALTRRVMALSGKTTAFHHATPWADQRQCPIIIQSLDLAFWTSVACLRRLERERFFFFWQL